MSSSGFHQLRGWQMEGHAQQVGPFLQALNLSSVKERGKGWSLSSISSLVRAHTHTNIYMIIKLHSFQYGVYSQVISKFNTFGHQNVKRCRDDTWDFVEGPTNQKKKRHVALSLNIEFYFFNIFITYGGNTYVMMISQFQHERERVSSLAPSNIKDTLIPKLILQCKYQFKNS